MYTSETPDGPSPFHYDEEHNSLVAGDVSIKMFSTVKVEIKVEGDEEGMRQKMRMKLVEPYVEGVSVFEGINDRKRKHRKDSPNSSSAKKSKAN